MHDCCITLSIALTIVYSDKVSRTTTAQAWGDDINYETSSAKQQPSTTVKTDCPTAPKRPTAAYKSRGSTQDVNNLKQQIVDRAREAGFKIDTSLFPWKGLLELLARFGYYLMGWPFESRLPGEKGTEKGISGLRAQEQTAVFAALADVENPLTFVRYKGNPRGKRSPSERLGALLTFSTRSYRWQCARHSRCTI